MNRSAICLLLSIPAVLVIAGCASSPITSVKPSSTASITGSVPSNLTTTPTAIFLTILQPADESVVGSNSITIGGQTIPDATVSINTDISEVDSNGRFSQQVTLDEGPNVFDIIATDEAGNEVSTQLVVSFSP